MTAIPELAQRFTAQIVEVDVSGQEIQLTPDFVTFMRQHVPHSTGVAFDARTQEVALYVTNSDAFDYVGLVHLLFPVYILDEGESVDDCLPCNDPNGRLPPFFAESWVRHHASCRELLGMTIAMWIAPWNRLAFGVREERQEGARRYLDSITPFRVMPTPTAMTTLHGMQLWEPNAELMPLAQIAHQST